MIPQTKQSHVSLTLLKPAALSLLLACLDMLALVVFVNLSIFPLELCAERQSQSVMLQTIVLDSLLAVRLTRFNRTELSATLDSIYVALNSVSLEFALRCLLRHRQFATRVQMSASLTDFAMGLALMDASHSRPSFLAVTTILNATSQTIVI
jgi:hypothetical protein